MAGNPESLIVLDHIDRKFQVGSEVVHALRQVNLTIEHGEYLSLMGPSGSGKSTLLNILGLLDRPDSGVYTLNGQNTTDLDDARQAHVRGSQIGFVFQFFHLVPRLSAFENVELPLMLRGDPVGERRDRVERILVRLGLASRMFHRPDQLSGGQRQRVAIARATINQPQLILADEPTGNLDSASGKEVIDLLEQLNAQGISLIVVTHDTEVGRRARRQLTLIDGRLARDLRVVTS